VVITAGLRLLSRIDAPTSVPVLSVYMAVLGIGVGMLMQNLVPAAHNDERRAKEREGGGDDDRSPVR
jgi:hypothetical protein